MRLTFLCAAVGLAWNTCLAQKICSIPKRGPSADAASAFEKIEDAIPIEAGKYLLYASSDQLVKDKSGALSVECPGGGGQERWIVYDPELIKGDALYFALAHEIAHHLNNDPMSGEALSKQQELSADGLAARYLARLNWTSQRLTQALNALPIPRDAKGLYPSLEERRARANEAYAGESARLRPVTEPAAIRSTPGASPPPAVQPVTNSPASAPALAAGTKRTNPKDGLMYVWTPPGHFRMGCSPGDKECRDNEQPVHEVTITKGFWIGQTEVTQEAYQKVTNSQNPSRFEGGKRPVEQISWDDADAYCRAMGGRLPTEAEWEYASRAASTESRYPDVADIAYYSKNSGGAPNAWGLYDTLGNVWEWTADWYADKLPAATTDPKGPASGQYRTLRGGPWNVPSASARASFRNRVEPDFRSFMIRVRCVGDLP